MNKKKLIMAVVGAAIVYFALDYTGYLPASMKRESVVPEAVDLSVGEQAANFTTSTGSVEAVAMPGSRPANITAPPIRLLTIPWNATMGLHFATGGTQTTDGSLMAKQGINLRVARQDDIEKMKAEQVQFANALAEGQSHPSVGAHFVVIMGDGAAQYIAAINEATKDLGSEYRAEVVGALGYSRGEDACFGPQEWKDNPQSARGGVISGYLRDGDWNLCLYWMANQGLKNNPDETTYDPEALNWVSTSDFMKAVEVYVAGHCEERKIVLNGKLTGESKSDVCVQGVATWTPGDVALAKQKGGLVRLISTKENAYQMPATVIGIRAWTTKNAKLVEGLLQAALEGSDQVKHHEAALSKAGQIAYNVYGDQSAAYWVKYYKGTKERDKTGNIVELGGSTTANLADNLVLFGLAEGTGGLKASLYNATYTGFGNVVKQQYPKLFPSFPPIEQAVNTQFVTNLANRLRPTEEEADVATFNESSGPIAAESVIARRNWNIQFNTGRADFTQSAETTLLQLYDQLLVGGALVIQIDGHTDNVGSPDANMALSEARAFAVKQWMEDKNPRLFPQGRISVRALGATSPIAPNSTADGRAANRRVTITLGTQE